MSWRSFHNLKVWGIRIHGEVYRCIRRLCFISGPAAGYIDLALTDLFKAHWTDMIHAEWINALLRQDKHSKETLERTRDRRLTAIFYFPFPA